MYVCIYIYICMYIYTAGAARSALAPLASKGLWGRMKYGERLAVVIAPSLALLLCLSFCLFACARGKNTKTKEQDTHNARAPLSLSFSQRESESERAREREGDSPVSAAERRGKLASPESVSAAASSSPLFAPASLEEFRLIVRQEFTELQQELMQGSQVSPANNSLLTSFQGSTTREHALASASYSSTTTLAASPLATATATPLRLAQVRGSKS
jgi:hypothetical protein